MSETTVDIVPIISSTGGYKKISDSDLYNNNNKVSTLLNFLEYCDTKNSIYPEMGIYLLLNSLSYSEDPESIVNQMSDQITKFLGFTVGVSYEYETRSYGDQNIILSFSITGLDGSIQVGTKSTNKGIKLVNPKYIVWGIKHGNKNR